MQLIQYNSDNGWKKNKKECCHLLSCLTWGSTETHRSWSWRLCRRRPVSGAPAQFAQRSAPMKMATPICLSVRKPGQVRLQHRVRHSMPIRECAYSPSPPKIPKLFISYRKLQLPSPYPKHNGRRYIKKKGTKRICQIRSNFKLEFIEGINSNEWWLNEKKKYFYFSLSNCLNSQFYIANLKRENRDFRVVVICLFGPNKDFMNRCSQTGKIKLQMYRFLGSYWLEIKSIDVLSEFWFKYK